MGLAVWSVLGTDSDSRVVGNGPFAFWPRKSPSKYMTESESTYGISEARFGILDDTNFRS